MNLIDMHVHLTHERYKEDLEQVIKSDIEAGVKKVLLIGCDKEEIQKCIKLKGKYPDYIYLAFGFHPVEVSKLDEESLIWLEEVIKKTEDVIAIGEIGLDYYWYPEEKEIQKKYFKKQIELAKKLNKPIIIHSRDSYDDCYDVLSEENYFEGIMHSFADNYEMARKFIEKGMYISISGPVTFKNGHNQKDVIKNININKLFIETDGPFLTPAPFRGKRNESKYLKYIVSEIAIIKELEEEEVEKTLYENSLGFLDKYSKG